MDDSGALRLIPYAGDVLRVLAESPGLAVCELTVPAHFPGPPPHIHHDFDEAIYVLDGELSVVTDRSEPRSASAGALLLAHAGPPDLARIGEIYRRHNSELAP